MCTATMSERTIGEVDLSEAQQKLMSALEELMLEKPMDVIRAVEIAERAGVSKQTFYNHYADKYALLDALYRNKFQESTGLMRSLKPHKECGYAFFATCRDNHTFLHNGFFSKDVNNLFGAMQRVMREDYAARLKAQEVSITTQIQFAIDFFSKGVTGFTRRWIENGMEISNEQAAELVYGCIPQILSEHFEG